MQGGRSNQFAGEGLIDPVLVPEKERKKERKRKRKI